MPQMRTTAWPGRRCTEKKNRIERFKYNLLTATFQILSRALQRYAARQISLRQIGRAT